MSASLDRECLNECGKGCKDCCSCKGCTKQDCAYCCKETLKRLALVFEILLNILSAMCIMYFCNITEKTEDLTLVVAVFWLVYSTFHMMMFNFCMAFGLKEVFPKVQAAFPKTKALFVYWIFCTVPIWYTVLWLPKIIYSISKSTTEYNNTKITTFTCFMFHFVVECVLYLMTCCVKFESQESALN